MSEPPKTSVVNIDDSESLYEFYSNSIPSSKTVIFQGTQKIPKTDILFYTPVDVGTKLTLKAMIDSGSMACTLSEAAEARLRQAMPDIKSYSAENIVIISCGGHQVTPKAMYDLDVTVYGCRMVIPALVVPGQAD